MGRPVDINGVSYRGRCKLENADRSWRELFPTFSAFTFALTSHIFAVQVLGHNFSVYN